MSNLLQSLLYEHLPSELHKPAAKFCCSADTPVPLQKLMGDCQPRWERILCKALIPVSVLLSILGIAFTITALVQYKD